MNNLINSIINSDCPEQKIHDLHPSVAKVRWLAKQMGKDSFQERTKNGMISELAHYILVARENRRAA